MTRGGEGVWEMGKMMTNDDKRGGGGQKSEKNDYVICERSLRVRYAGDLLRGHPAPRV